jgi:hypothetical protein
VVVLVVVVDVVVLVVVDVVVVVVLGVVVDGPVVVVVVAVVVVVGSVVVVVGSVVVVVDVVVVEVVVVVVVVKVVVVDVVDLVVVVVEVVLVVVVLDDDVVVVVPPLNIVPLSLPTAMPTNRPRPRKLRPKRIMAFGAKSAMWAIALAPKRAWRPPTFTVTGNASFDGPNTDPFPRRRFPATLMVDGASTITFAVFPTLKVANS